MVYKANSEEIVNIDGVNLHMFTFLYNPDLPFALIVHGHRADTDRIIPFIKLLESKYNVISFDLPGFGTTTEVGEFDDYIEYCSDILNKFIKKIELNTAETSIIGMSLGANIIIDYLVKNPESKFQKVGLMGPIFSYKGISMKPTYKKFVYWFCKKLEKGGLFSKFLQKGFDSRFMFKYLSMLFDKECFHNPKIREYEYRQWHLMTLQHWGSTLYDFLTIDYSTSDKVLNLDDMIFVYPKSDQYLDVDYSISTFKKMFPKAQFKFFESTKHVPRGNFEEDEDFMNSIRDILKLLD